MNERLIPPVAGFGDVVSLKATNKNTYVTVNGIFDNECQSKYIIVLYFNQYKIEEVIVFTLL